MFMLTKAIKKARDHEKNQGFFNLGIIFLGHTLMFTVFTEIESAPKWAPFEAKLFLDTPGQVFSSFYHK